MAQPSGRQSYKCGKIRVVVDVVQPDYDDIVYEATVYTPAGSGYAFKTVKLAALSDRIDTLHDLVYDALALLGYEA